MESQTGECGEVQELNEVHSEAVKTDALFQAVKEKTQGKSSLDSLSILESACNRKLSCEELSQLSDKPDPGPEKLIRHFWYALAFEAYFAGHPRANRRVHLLPPPKLPTATCGAKPTDYGSQ